MSKERKDYIYASGSKLKNDEINPLDINTTYDSEHTAITQLVTTGLSDDVKSKYDNGSEVTIYLYRLDSEKSPVLYKSARITKNDDTFKIVDSTKYDVPESFQPFQGGSDTEPESTGDTENAPVENQEQPAEADVSAETDNSAENTEEQKSEETPAENKDQNTESPAENSEETTNESVATVGVIAGSLLALQELNTLLLMARDKIITSVKKPKYKKFFKKYRELIIPDAPDIFSLKKEKIFLKEDGSESDNKKLDFIKKYGLGKEKSQIIYFEDKNSPVAGIIMDKEFSCMFTLLANGHGIEAILMNLAQIIDKSSQIKVVSKYSKYSDYITACIDIDCGIISKRAKSFFKKAKKEIADAIEEAKKSEVVKEDANPSDFARLNRDLGKESNSPSNDTQNKTNQPTEKPGSQVMNAVKKMNQATENSNKALQEAAILISEFESSLYDGFPYAKMDEICEETCKALEESGSVEPMSAYIYRNYVCEKTLKAKDRNALDDSDFGIPSERKFPIHDEAHVRAAIQRFNYVDAKNEKLLAKNIIKKLKDFDLLDSINVSEDNRFSKYLGKSFKEFTESYDINPIPMVREFNVGSMLPMMGSTSGWGTDFSNSEIHAIVADTDNEIIRNYATLYDTKDAVKNAKDTSDEITYTGVDDVDRKESSQQVTYEHMMCNCWPEKHLWFDDCAKKFASCLSIMMPIDFDPEKDCDCARSFDKCCYNFCLDPNMMRDCNDIICRCLEKDGWTCDNTDGEIICATKKDDYMPRSICACIKPYKALASLSMGPEPVSAPENELNLEAAFMESKDEHKHAKIDPDIQSVITRLNKLGYKTIASCSGHPHARVKNDTYRDGVLNGKLYTTARIVFDKDYDIGSPKGWSSKDFEKGFGIYPDPNNYTYSKGVPDEAFIKWKVDYMDALKDWVDKLEEKEKKEEEKETEESVSNLFEDFVKMNF